jgi:hypothetical protein
MLKDKTDSSSLWTIISILIFVVLAIYLLTQDASLVGPS